MERHELETMRTVADMDVIVQRFYDRREFSDVEVRMRAAGGIVKDLVEEYIPLWLLAREVPNTVSAGLSVRGVEGPDATLRLADGTELKVQITCAGESHESALQRELLNRREVVFAAAVPERSGSGIRQAGRCLTTRDMRQHQIVEAVTDAVAKKKNRFHEGTDILLVSVSHSLVGVEASVCAELRHWLRNAGAAPYNAVYVSAASSCFLAVDGI